MDAEVGQLLLIVVGDLVHVGLDQQGQLDLDGLLLFSELELTALQPVLELVVLSPVKLELVAVAQLDPLVFLVGVFDLLGLAVNEQPEPVDLALQLLNVGFVEVGEVLDLETGEFLKLGLFFHQGGLKNDLVVGQLGEQVLLVLFVAHRFELVGLLLLVHAFAHRLEVLRLVHELLLEALDLQGQGPRLQLLLSLGASLLRGQVLLELPLSLLALHLELLPQVLELVLNGSGLVLQPVLLDPLEGLGVLKLHLLGLELLLEPVDLDLIELLGIVLHIPQVLHLGEHALLELPLSLLDLFVLLYLNPVLLLVQLGYLLE